MIRPSIYQSVFILVVLLAFSFILVGILTPSWELVTVGNKINGASVYYRLGLGKWCLSPSDDLTECREITVRHS